jgi:putative transposase
LKSEQTALIEWENASLPITTQADLLSLNRSSLYYKPVPPSPEEIALKYQIDEIYTMYPFFGSRRITAMLHIENVQIHRNTVQKYIREMGIQAIYPKSKMSQKWVSLSSVMRN